MQNIVFIINPVSGYGQKIGIEDKINREYEEDKNCRIEIYYTKAQGDAVSASERFIVAGFNILVAVGGDGTVNQVGQSVLKARLGLAPFSQKYDVKLGIIPLGSGNGLGRHLHIPMDATTAIKVIHSGKLLYADAGYINERFFFCTAGVGFDATVGYRFNTSPKRGLIKYVELTAETYSTYQRKHYSVQLDNDHIETDAFLITFANASQWGYNFFVAPDASVFDGQLDVVLWRRAPLLTIPIMAVELLTKTIRDDLFVDTYRCKKVVIERPEDDYVHYDGEAAVMGTRIEAGIHHQLLPVIIP